MWFCSHSFFPFFRLGTGPLFVLWWSLSFYCFSTRWFSSCNPLDWAYRYHVLNFKYTLYFLLFTYIIWVCMSILMSPDIVIQSVIVFCWWFMFCFKCVDIGYPMIEICVGFINCTLLDRGFRSSLQIKLCRIFDRFSRVRLF